MGELCVVRCTADRRNVYEGSAEDCCARMRRLGPGYHVERLAGCAVLAWCEPADAELDYSAELAMCAEWDAVLP